jgi:2',3'-cyclic-nucleotide 2'-phosphodiesterase
MKILYCGDVVGRPGRKIIAEKLPELRKALNLDFVIVNAENAAHGFGLTPKIYQEIKSAGADAVTLGNHTFDKKEIIPFLQEENDLVRPANYPEGTPGKGAKVFTLADGRKIAVLQVLGTLYMHAVLHPFETLDTLLAQYRLQENVQFVFVDIHCEATSEKVATGFYCDGRASLVAGTHTHIPTADAQILPKGTGFITDVGMCGTYRSVIGMTPETALGRFFPDRKSMPLQPANDSATLCAVFCETDDKTGKAVKIFPVRVGGYLEESFKVC